MREQQNRKLKYDSKWKCCLFRATNRTSCMLYLVLFYWKWTKLLKKKTEKIEWIKVLEQRRGLWKQVYAYYQAPCAKDYCTKIQITLHVLHAYNATYYMATSCSASRPDEPNPVLWLATWAGKIGCLAHLGFHYLLLSGQNGMTMVLKLFWQFTNLQWV